MAYVQEQKFTSTADIKKAMKEMFCDVIQQVIEVELEAELGRERCQRSEARRRDVKTITTGTPRKR